MAISYRQRETRPGTEEETLSVSFSHLLTADNSTSLTYRGIVKINTLQVVLGLDTVVVGGAYKHLRHIQLLPLL